MNPSSTWADEYLHKTKTPARACRLIQRGMRVFIGSYCGEPQCLVRELADQSDRLYDVEIVRMLTLEVVPLTLIADQTGSKSLTMRSFYLGSAKPRKLSEMKRFITPINLSAVPRLFKSRQLPLNVALIQVGKPDDFGWMSLGVSVDVTLAAARAADVVIAQVNPKMPRAMGQSFLHVNEVDVIVEWEEDLLEPSPAAEVPESEVIAQHVAKLVEDGSTLQLSLGNTPQALLRALAGKNDLGVHTQFLTGGIMRLFSAGVINNREKGFMEGKLVASAAIGSRDLYNFLDDNPAIEFHPSDFVNDPAIIARNKRMVSLNVALAMDLTGQVAVDAMEYNNFSGVTGVMDFVRGAAASPGGKSVIMLPSTTMDGSSSRIVPTLENIPVVVPRGDAQYVATEYGVVNLFGKSIQERALAMISISHPALREELFSQAKQAGLVGPERLFAEAATRGVYPLNLEEDILVQGDRLLMRPAKPTDDRQLQEHFYNLPMEDVVRRFWHERTHFFSEEVEDFSQVDYVRALTLVVVSGDPGFEKVIAMGAYFLDEKKNMAETAYSVNAEWQGKGLAGRIQAKLAEAARENGISGLLAYTLPSNRGMIAVFHKLPYKVVTTLDDDMVVLSCRFDQPTPKPLGT